MTSSFPTTFWAPTSQGRTISSTDRTLMHLHLPSYLWRKTLASRSQEPSKRPQTSRTSSLPCRTTSTVWTKTIWPHQGRIRTTSLEAQCSSSKIKGSRYRLQRRALICRSPWCSQWVQTCWISQSTSCSQTWMQNSSSKSITWCRSNSCHLKEIAVTILVCNSSYWWEPRTAHKWWHRGQDLSLRTLRTISSRHSSNSRSWTTPICSRVTSCRQLSQGIRARICRFSTRCCSSNSSSSLSHSWSEETNQCQKPRKGRSLETKRLLHTYTNLV